MTAVQICGRSWKAYSALLGGFLMHLTIGTLYCWGNLNPYVTSYIRAYSAPATLRYGDTVWTFALGNTGQGLAMFLGGILEKKIGSRFASLTGGLITSLGVFLSAFSVKSSYYLFLLTYGFMFGIGVGITYAPPLSVAMKWFPEHKGLVNGVIVAGFGGGAFIFDQIQTQYINPLNVKAVNASVLNTTQHIGTDKYFIDEEVLSRVPNVFFLLSGCYTVMQIIAATLICSPPSPTEEFSHVNEERQTLVDSEPESDLAGFPSTEGQLSFSPRQIIRTRHFVTLWTMFLLNGMVVLFISTLYKTYGQSEVTNDDRLLTTLGAIAAVFNAFGRIFWGLVADRFSFKLAIVCLCAVMTVLMSSLYMSHLLAATAGPTLLFIWICLIFFSFSGNFSLFPTACAKTFGPKYTSINYGVLFTSACVAGPVGALLSTFLLQKLHSYGLFILSACLSLTAMVLGLTFPSRGPNGKLI